jgi:hypothetical protein
MDYTPTLVLHLDFSGGTHCSLGTLGGHYPNAAKSCRIYLQEESLNLRRDDYITILQEDNSAARRYVGTAWGSCRVLKISDEEADDLRARSKLNTADDQRRETLRELTTLQRSIANRNRAELNTTRSEATKSAQRWAAIHNEGGEGFAPHILSQEEYDDITDRIRTLQTNLNLNTHLQL